ncbi:hypothetical protein QFC22_006306 [Naganishia vaughanmartiniae]|uniref:Uncharacterized protein n=1 Tax=Naganishia vaughanmartiniae TaxID=1424756 RepID=A0ACC2WKP8_9TREE|nr:hypothetical protein QFC22_006306 [Naganishia vaughanmartiniae]
MVLPGDASGEKGTRGGAANLGKSLLEGLDTLSRGSRKLQLRIDAVEQGVTLTREVIENSLHDVSMLSPDMLGFLVNVCTYRKWQEAIIEAILSMQTYKDPVPLVTRLRQLKALHRDLYTSITRVLKKKGTVHAVTFRAAGEGHREKVSGGDGITRNHIKNKAAEKREFSRASLRVDTRRKGGLQAEKYSKTRVEERIMSEKDKKITPPPKQPEHSPKSSKWSQVISGWFRVQYGIEQHEVQSLFTDISA